MADSGPSIKLPFSAEVFSFLGDAKEAAASARKEIAAADKELKAFAKAGKVVTTAMIDRRKQAEITFKKYDAVLKQDQRFKSAERTAKFARGFAQAQSVQQILSGNLNVGAVVNLLASDKIMNKLESAFIKARLPKLGAALGRIGPIAGIAEIVTNQVIDRVDEYYKTEAAISRSTINRISFARAHGMSPQQSRSLLSQEENRLKERNRRADILFGGGKTTLEQAEVLRNRTVDFFGKAALSTAIGGTNADAVYGFFGAQSFSAESKKNTEERQKVIAEAESVADEIGITTDVIMQEALKQTGKKRIGQLTRSDISAAKYSLLERATNMSNTSSLGMIKNVQELKRQEAIKQEGMSLEEITAQNFFEANPLYRKLLENNPLQPRFVARQEAAKQQAKAQLNSNQYDPWHQSERDQQLDALRVLRSDEDPDVREYARTEMARLINGNPQKKSQNKSDAASEVVQMNMKRQGIFSSGNTSAYLDTNGSWVPENERNDYKGPSERKQAGIYSSGNDFGGWVPEGDQNDYKGPSEKRASGIYSGGNTAGYLSMNNNWIPEGINDFVTWQLKQDVKTSVQGASRNERVGAYSGD